MESTSAIEAMAALAQAHRLDIFRALVKQGGSGLSAGELATHIGISPSSLSFHAAQLERAGLIESRRASRNVIYSIDVGGIRDLLNFLTEDCCNGHPELCGGLSCAVDISSDRGEFVNERRQKL
jgi:ArsR family transcriptional regulator